MPKSMARMGADLIPMVAIVLVGSVLRFIGLTWGLPARLHADEWVIFDGAVDLAARNSFEPSLFLRPDHVEIKLSYLAYAAFARLTSGVPVEVDFATDPGPYMWISRAITALFGVAMIVLAYFIGRFVSRFTALGSAVAFAVYPPFVDHSHYATPDIPLTAMFMVVVLACMHYLRKPSLPALLIASAASAAAIAIKYPGAIATMIIALVVIIASARERRWLRLIRDGFIAIAAVAGSLFLISPVLFTNLSGVAASIRQESRSGGNDLGFPGNLGFYIVEFVDAAGYIALILTLIGIFAAVSQRQVILLPILLGALTWLILSTLSMHWERWGVPMAITPLFLAVIGLEYVARRLRTAQRFRRWSDAIVGVIGAVVTLNMLLASLAGSLMLLAPDTRLQARGDLDRLGITPENTISEGYSPFEPEVPRDIFTDLDTSGGDVRSASAEAEYVLLSGCFHGRFLPESKYPEEHEFLDAIRRLPQVYALSRGRERHPSPVEIPNMIDSVEAAIRYIGGSPTGCDITVYRLSD